MNAEKRELRKFGISVGIVLGIIAGIILYFKGVTLGFQIVSAIGGLLFVFGALLPAALAPVHKIWMKFAAGLAYVNTRIFLTLIYYFIFLPVGIVMRLFGRDELRIKEYRSKDSFWIKREKPLGPPERYEKQY